MGIKDIPGLRMRGNSVVIDKYVNGVRIYETLGPVTLTTAQKILAKRITDVLEHKFLPENRVSSLTVVEILNNFWEQHLKFKEYAKDTRYILSAVADRLGDMPVMKLSRSDIDMYKRERALDTKKNRCKGTISPRTIQKELQHLSMAINRAVDDKKIPQNPIKGFITVPQGLPKKIVIDDVYRIRAIVSQWIADSSIQAILVTGGTGFTGRDSTPEALGVLFDKTIEGFGELFRHLSFEEIGTSTIQSRALAGLANETVIFCMPGSTSACKTAWGKIIREQLDSTYRPCNFVGVLHTRSQQRDA